MEESIERTHNALNPTCQFGSNQVGLWEGKEKMKCRLKKKIDRISDLLSYIPHALVSPVGLPQLSHPREKPQ